MSGNGQKPVNQLLTPVLNVAAANSSLKVNASGSATGNPRNKCALKPGYSLMGWIRLGSSGEDLTGTKGRVISVTSEELSKHNKQDDAWLAIRGKVYNVTRYMDYHPGGTEELMRGVGRDATRLFDQVHAWVNYQQLLAKCYIGPLRNVVKIDEDLLEALKPPTKPKAPSEPASLTPTDAKPTLTEVTPRFDWTQKRSDLTLYFYTKKFCNPALILQRTGPQGLRIRVQIGNSAHVFQFEMLQNLEFPPKAVRVSGETGKAEIILLKSKEELWTGYGAHKVAKQSAWFNTEVDSEELNYDFEIDHKETFNHDSFAMSLKCPDTLIIVPLGLHVTIKAMVNGTLVERNYTPVDHKFLPEAFTRNSANTSGLNFLIKSYATNGFLSTHLLSLPSNGSSLQITPPKGNFQLEKLSKYINFVFLAAGSGLTPFLNLISFLLQRTNNRIEKLSLLYFNKTEDDIWCRKELESIMETDKRFEYINILSQNTSDEWTGRTGRINKDSISGFIAHKSSTFIAACGSEGFNEAAKQILADLNFGEDQMHIFQG